MTAKIPTTIQRSFLCLIFLISMFMIWLSLYFMTTDRSSSTINRPAKFSFTSYNNKLTGKSFWESIEPGFTCPADLRRVGRSGDGGKWMCGLANLGRLPRNGTAAPCHVYSFGVARDSSFEAQVLKETACDLFAYDPSVNKIGAPITPSNPRVHFKRLGIAENDKKDNGTGRTLKTLMRENGHKWIDILKMDVEGSEYAVFKKMFEDFVGDLPIGQLLLEVHVHDWTNTNSMVKEDQKNMLRLFSQLEKAGLRMFNYEINPSGFYCCAEVSLISTKRLALERFLNISPISHQSHS